MPNFWDSLKSVGLQAASTAGQVYQSTLGNLTGVANEKINQVAGSVQSQVGNITKPKSAAPTQSTPPPAPFIPAKSAGIGLAGLLIIGAIAFLLLRKD